MYLVETRGRFKIELGCYIKKIPKAKSQAAPVAEEERKQDAILFLYKDSRGDLELAGNRGYFRYGQLHYEAVMRDLIQQFCDKYTKSKTHWEGDYVRDELFAKDCNFELGKNKLVYMVHCDVKKSVYQQTDKDSEFDPKDIRVKAILLASYYGKKNGIYINLVASGKNESAKPILDYFLKVFYNGGPTEVIDVEEVKPFKEIFGDEKELVIPLASKVLLDSVPSAVGYYFDKYNFTVQNRCNTEKDVQSYSIIEYAKLSKKNTAYANTTGLTAAEQRKKMTFMAAFSAYEKDFFQTLKSKGFMVSGDKNSLVRMRLCPKSATTLYVEDEVFQTYLDDAEKKSLSRKKKRRA
jgi:hypothetical protein